MAVPITIPTNLPKSLMTTLIALGTVKLMIATDTFVPNQDTLDFINDVTNEVAASTGYPTGGITVTGAVLSVDTVANKVTLTIDPVAPSGLAVSGRWGFLHIWTGTASTSPVVAILDFSQQLGGNVTINAFNPDASGIMAFTVPS